MEKEKNSKLLEFKKRNYLCEYGEFEYNDIYNL